MEIAHMLCVIKRVDGLHPFEVGDKGKLVYKAKNKLPESEIMKWH